MTIGRNRAQKVRVENLSTAVVGAESFMSVSERFVAIGMRRRYPRGENLENGSKVFLLMTETAHDRTLPYVQR